MGRITPAGVITMFPTLTTNSEPEGVTAVGADGNIWFSKANRNKIGRLTTDGVMTEFDLPQSDEPTRRRDGGARRRPLVRTAGREPHRPDHDAGSEWTPVVHFRRPPANPWNITVGADGNLWFSEGAANKIGRITPDGDHHRVPAAEHRERPTT